MATVSIDYTTISRKYSDKWLLRIANVRAFTLENGFNGKPCDVNAVRWCVERIGNRLQISKDRRHGRLRSHSNCWFEFEVTP
jgi:hypothetical protein